MQTRRNQRGRLHREWIIQLCVTGITSLWLRSAFLCRFLELLLSALCYCFVFCDTNSFCFVVSCYYFLSAVMMSLERGVCCHSYIKSVSFIIFRILSIIYGMELTYQYNLRNLLHSNWFLFWNLRTITLNR